MTLASRRQAAHDFGMMARPTRLLVLVPMAMMLTAPSSDAADREGGCVVIRPSTAFAGTGYLHYATVTNECSAAVRCSLWTDVDPPPVSVDVDQGQSADVTFRRGSPAHDFRAFARCAFR